MSSNDAVSTPSTQKSNSSDNSGSTARTTTMKPGERDTPVYARTVPRDRPTNKITLSGKLRLAVKPAKKETVAAKLLEPSHFYKHGDIMDYINKYLLTHPKNAQRVLDWLDENDMIPPQAANMSVVSYLIASPKLHDIAKKNLVDNVKSCPTALDVFIDIMPSVNDKYDMVLYSIVRAFGGNNAADVLKPHEITSLLDHFESRNLVAFTWLSKYRDEVAPKPLYMREGKAPENVQPDTTDYSNQPVILTTEVTRSPQWKYERVPSGLKSDKPKLLEIDLARRLQSNFPPVEDGTGGDLIRKFGPCNPFYGDASLPHEQKYMFMCTIHDYDIDDEVVEFDERCEYSGMKIESPRYAYRLAKRQGGWESWFSSYENLIKYIKACASDDMEWELKMAEQTKELLEKYGVYEEL